MGKFAIADMDDSYSKKLMAIHQKNLDAYVNANKIVAEGYHSIAAQQVDIFQESLTKMIGCTPENAGDIAKAIFTESTQQMQELLTLATKAHQSAFDILSARTKDLVTESKL